MEKLTYHRAGDYLLPDLEVDEQPQGDIGPYGRLREKYLKEERSGLYMELVMSVRLKAHLLDIDREAREMEGRLVEQMKKRRGVTEQLKARDQMRWVGEMNNIRASAREVVLHDLIYV